VQNIPLLIQTQNYYDNYPLRTKIDLAGEQYPVDFSNKLAFSDNSTSFIDNKYFFGVKPINNSVYYDVAFSNKTYEQGQGYFEMIATQTNTTTHNLNIELSDSIITQIKYKDILRVSDVKIFAGGYLLIPERKSFTDAKLLGKYHSQFGNLNNTYYIYAGAPIIDQRIDSQYDTTINMILHGYYYYYIDETINGNNTGCYEKSADSAIFYNSDNGLLIKFDDGSSADKKPILFCLNDDYSITLNISIGMRNESWMRYIFYTGDMAQANAQKKIITAFGIPKNVFGVSDEKLILLNMTDYASLKKNWKYPVGRDFRIKLVNSTTSIGNNPPELNIFAKNYDTYYLDKFGTKTPVKFSLQAW